MSHELSEGAAKLRAAAKPEAAYPTFRRRRFLIDRRYQLKIGLLSAMAVMLLLVLVNMLWYGSVMTATDILADTPNLAQRLADEHRVLYFRILMAAGVTLIGVVLVSILETHRTAGPAYAIEKRLREIGEGRLASRVTLRKNDNLQSLGTAFNEVGQALQQRELDEIESLDGLADRAARVTDAAGARQIVTGLARLADEKRKRTE